MIRDKHPLAGQTVKLRKHIGLIALGLGGAEFTVEDWADNVLGGSVWAANGNPAALEYAVRRAIQDLPIDENTVYGKVGGFGHIVHDSEIERATD